MHEQDQFLTVVDRDEAERRFRAVLDLTPRASERILLEDALGRVLSEDVCSPVDVPSFDRSNVDGFAVIAEDTFGASEERPVRLQLAAEVLHTGVVTTSQVVQGTAMAIATGGMLPRGADAVVMVEHCDTCGAELRIGKSVTAGSGVSFAGTDITTGETVLRAGQVLTSRETGVLAAIGIREVAVWRKPVVAIISTGDEILAPGLPMQPAMVYDSNAQILADAVRELGSQPLRLGIVSDDLQKLRARVEEAIASADVVLLSGGTSKGAGDISYRVVTELNDPGVVVHGVALKPGKPICLAATRGKPVVVLPGFPTSAIFTFHEFVAPVLRALAGRTTADRATVRARLALKLNSEIGRTEYLLVGLIAAAESSDVPADSSADGNARAPLVAYPMGKGSGSVTTFSRADGFVTIDRHTEIVEAGTLVDVQLIGGELQLADLVVIGSHCVGLDFLLGELERRGCRTRFLAVGSTAGLEAAKRGECDLAGVHLLDADTGEYNRPFLTPGLELIAGYRRLQGVAFRQGDLRFSGGTAQEAIDRVKSDRTCLMVNRNQGSGTRVLIDRMLQGAKPAGYAVQPRNHHAVAAAIVQRRADWGVTLETIARGSGLGFLPLQEEHFDFVCPRSRLNSPVVSQFRSLLQEKFVLERLAACGFYVD